MADPTSIPVFYRPNTSLTWVQKATYVFPLHPENPRLLEINHDPLIPGSGWELDVTNPASTILTPENVMQFNGGGYIGNWTFVFGDDPAVSGIARPPAIGAISFWFYPYSFGATNTTRMVGQRADSNPWVGLNTGLNLQASCGATSSTVSIGLLNQWYHVTLTNNGTFRRLYINGNKMNEAANDSTSGAGQELSIGYISRSTGPNVAFSGRIRLVAVINGAVWTDTEIFEQASRPYAYYGPAPNGLVLSELKTELTTDPEAYGYAALITAGLMQGLADMLNLVRPGIPQVYKNVVTHADLNNNVDSTEFYALTPARQSLWEAYTRNDLDMRLAPAMRYKINELFPPGSSSVSNLDSMAWKRDSTRAEQLWGTDVKIKWQDCSAALALP